MIWPSRVTSAITAATPLIWSGGEGLVVDVTATAGCVLGGLSAGATFIVLLMSGMITLSFAVLSIASPAALRSSSAPSIVVWAKELLMFADLTETASNCGDVCALSASVTFS